MNILLDDFCNPVILNIIRQQVVGFEEKIHRIEEKVKKDIERVKRDIEDALLILILALRLLEGTVGDTKKNNNIIHYDISRALSSSEDIHPENPNFVEFLRRGDNLCLAS